MIDLAETRERVRAIALPSSDPFFLSVSDALSAADAMEHLDANPPAAFVYMASERAEPNALAAGGRRQRVNSTVAVLILLGAERADGERADPLEIARGLVIASLVGFKPSGAGKAFDYASYRVLQISDGMIWCECLFNAPWVIASDT